MEEEGQDLGCEGGKEWVKDGGESERQTEIGRQTDSWKDRQREY